MTDSDLLSRRAVLRTAGVGAATAALGPLAAAQQPQPTKVDPPKTIELYELDAPTEQKTPPPPAPFPPRGRVGYALVGLGHLTLGQILPAIQKTQRCRVAALVTGDRAKGLEVARQYGVPEASVYTYAEYDRLKDDASVQAVYVVLPNGLHEEYVVRAAKAGKHVLCEKPMANSSAEARRMVEACKAANRKLMIAYRIQYEPHNRLAHDWTRAQKYGKVKLIESYNGQNQAHNDQWRHKKALAGGGSLPDIGLYNLNTTRYLLGEEPVEVNATLFSTPGDDRFREVEESVLWQMRFPSGALANCACGYGAHQARRYRVLAESGWYGLDPAFAYDGLRMESSYAEGPVEFRQSPSKGSKDQFALEMDHFARCVMDDVRPFTPGEEGVQDHVVMEAIYRSAHEGKVVRLPEIATKDTFRGPLPQEGS